MKRKATSGYESLRHREPSVVQQNAIDLLAVGKSDTDTAAALGMHRVTVTKWRLYCPVFQAALNRRRADIWAGAGDRLRALIPTALDVLAGTLEDPTHPSRVKAAIALLRLVRLKDDAAPAGLTDPDALVRKIVEKRRSATRGWSETLLEQDKGLPPFDDHLQQVAGELADLADGGNDADLTLNGTQNGA